MKFLSVCSGIDAASVAWLPIGFECVGFSEIEKFPSRVLKHHYPDVPNFGGRSPRPRLFLVGHSRAGCAGEILFEPESIGRDRPPKTPAGPVLTARGGMAFDDRTPCVLETRGARIATPLEWERSLGFPDGYTAIPGAADGPRYKSLGNSIDCKTLRWLGGRILKVAHMEAAP